MKKEYVKPEIIVKGAVVADSSMARPGMGNCKVTYVEK